MWIRTAIVSLLLGLGAGVSPGAVRAATMEQTVEFAAAYGTYTKLMAAGDESGAFPYAERAYQLGKAIYGDESPDVAALAINYGRGLLLMRRRDEAREVLKSAVDVYEKIHGAMAPEMIGPLMELGRASGSDENPAPQRRIFERALAIAEQQDGAGSLLYARLLVQGGAEFMQLHAFVEARTYLEEAEAIFKKSGSPKDEWMRLAEFELGKVYLSQRKLDSAEAHLVQALDTFSDPDRPSNRLELTTHAFLVEVYQRKGEPEAATQHCLAIGRMTPFKSTQDYLPLFKREPQYPWQELVAGREAEVIVEFTVDAQGIVRDARVAETNGNSNFQKAALDAVKDFRYAPRFVDGEPVPTTGVKNRIKFVIAK